MPVVQSRSVQGVNTTSVALAFSSNVVAGNAIIVCCGLFGTVGFTAGGCADGVNTYTRDVSNFDGAHSIGSAIYSAPNAVGGATTVTVSGLAAGSFPSIAIYEVSGLLSSGIFDQSASNSGSSATHSTGTTPTTTQANEIAFAVDTHGGGTSTPTVSNGFTLGQVQTNSSNQPLGTAWKILSATGVQTTSFTWQSAQFDACIACYKATTTATSDIILPQVRMPQAILAR